MKEVAHIAQFDPKLIKIIVFDVDDTLTRGTMDVKAKAWEELFSDRLDKLQEARELYEKTGKGDRYNIISHTIGEPQKSCQSNPLVVVWAEKFENLIRERIRGNGIHPDDRKAIEILKQAEYRMYLLSVVPQDSLDNNMQYFVGRYPELESAFVQFIGTSQTGGKKVPLKNIAEENKLEPRQLVMIGDGESDYSGARGAGTQFIGIVPKGKEDKWGDDYFPKLQSIAELPEILLF